MRERHEKDGLVRYHDVLFNSIPDNYKINSIFSENGEFYDLSYLGLQKFLTETYADKELGDYDFGKEFQDENFIRKDVFYHLALDYLNSARFLRMGVNADRGKNMASNYLIPCTYLCKHSIELIIKRSLLEKGITSFRGHSVKKLWELLNETTIPHFIELDSFIDEVEKIDGDEMALRYGLDNQFHLLPANYSFDIDAFLVNTMFLFNILEEYVISKAVC